MPIPLTLFKNLSYPLIATTSAGSGALVMYFAKPEIDLEGKRKKWGEDKQKLRSEIDELEKESKSIKDMWDGRAFIEGKSSNKLVNFNLTMYGAEVNKYANCLDRLFDEITKNNISYYVDIERGITKCGKTPEPIKLPEEET